MAFSEKIILLLAPKYLPGLVVFQYVVSSCFLIGFLRILQTYYSAAHKIPLVAFFVVLQGIILAGISFFALSLVHL
jgi:hypothetical protein